MRTSLATTLSRSFSLLQAMAGGDAGLAFGDATAAVRAAPSTASRLLRALVEAELARRDPDGRYRVGRRFRAVAAAAIAAPDLATDAIAAADALAAATGESAAVFQPVEDGVRLVAKHEPPERFHYMAVGGVNRNCDRHGFCLLRAAWWDPRSARRRHGAAAGAPPPAAWTARLARARRDRVVANRDDDQAGIGRVVAAAVDARGSLVALVGVTATAEAVARREAELRAAVVAAAAHLARRLGSAA